MINTLAIVVIAGYPIVALLQKRRSLWFRIVAIIAGELVFVFGCNLLNFKLSWSQQYIPMFVGMAGFVFLKVVDNKHYNSHIK
jgi:hypothetical protein